MMMNIGVVVYFAGIDSSIAGPQLVGVDSLVGTLRIEDEGRDIARPGVRSSVFEPFYAEVSFGTAMKTFELGVDGVLPGAQLFGELEA